MSAADDFPTAFFAVIRGSVLGIGHRALIDGDGKKVGVAFPSLATPGDILICLRTDLLDAMEATRKAAAS